MRLMRAERIGRQGIVGRRKGASPRATANRMVFTQAATVVPMTRMVQPAWMGCENQDGQTARRVQAARPPTCPLQKLQPDRISPVFRNRIPTPMAHTRFPRRYEMRAESA